MKHFFSVIAYFLFLNLSQAQNTKIRGIVKDAKTNEALIGVNVQIDSSTTGTVTDLDGNYELNVKAGKIKIIFSYIGYDNKIVDASIKSNSTKVIDMLMGESQSLLDEIVVTGSKFEKKLGEETVSIDIIKPAFLEKQNITKMDDAVKKSPGVTVIDGQPNIRGGSGYSYGAGSRVLLLLDDLPILQADAGFPNWGSIPTENISQIEIIKGASSALYGSSAMNGIINIRSAYATSTPVTTLSLYGSVSDNPNPNDFNALANKIKVDKKWWNIDTLRVGSELVDISNQKRPHEFGLQFGHRQKFKHVDINLGAQISQKQGYKYPDIEKKMRINGNIRYRINDKMSIGVNGTIQSTKSTSFFLWGGSNGVNKYLPGALTGVPTETKGFRLLIDPYFTYADTKGNKHKILGRINKTDNDNTNNQSNFSNLFYGEYQYQRNISKWNFVITGGVVASYVKVKAQLYINPISTGRNIAGYFQLDKKFFNKLNCSVGFRVENNKISKTKAETKPVVRVGLNYQPAKYTYIRASFGQGYRFPTIAEKFIYTKLGSSLEIRPNEDLISETGFSAELGIKQGIKIGKNFNAFLDVSAFYTDYNNMMEFNPGVDIIDSKPVIYFQSRNVGNTRIYGTEATIMGEGKIANKFPSTLMLGYTYIVPQYKKYTEEKYGDENDIAHFNLLKYRFTHTFTGAWDIEFGRFQFGISGQYYSFMRNYDRVFYDLLGLSNYVTPRIKKGTDITDKKTKFKGDFILDLRAGVILGKAKNYVLSFQVKNATNREYTLRPALVEAPRSYSFRVDMSWK